MCAVKNAIDRENTLGPERSFCYVQNQDEISFEMETNDDATVVTLRLVATSPMTVGDLIMALESYLNDLTKAEKQKREPGIRTH